ncbi:putative sulfate/molybdate transporter [Methanogenium sp. S4BF]|uniref:putative sulfate/molybdate transporter n=1 Tax=Methanogenium sp. S4BF TaxID=1789226 RepID=UPI0024164DB7|nr:putative sulfate/molybdate transporter [Methanogenium sp. S4BF]WFN33691.1 putative sulfate/molybdate transporter [Methanogenium sp. S4BF]
MDLLTEHPYNKEDLPKPAFTLREAAGSVGDFGTILPIVFGVALVSDMHISHILFFFAVWFIISGYYYRLPVPIEPMKAIGAVVIAGSLTQDIIAASGIIVGIFFLLAGLMRWMETLKRYIPQNVIRGVQAGLALLLLRSAFGFATGDIIPFAVATLVIGLFWVGAKYTRLPDISALIVVFGGVGAGILISGMPEFALPALPTLFLPSPGVFVPAFTDLVLPQVPLTITNAILATSLLTIDLFRHEIKPDRLSATIGVMNLVSVPFGGFPMCHGAGGMAGQYRFGARTGGANIIAGIILLAFAIFFASAGVLSIIPTGIFGALLLFVAIELGIHATKTDSPVVTGVMAVLSLAGTITIAFIVGMVLAWGRIGYRKRKGRKAGAGETNTPQEQSEE